MLEKEFAGINSMNFVSKEAVIKISKFPKEERKTFIAKVYDEHTLVHELLHCKYNFLECSGSYESTYVDTLDPQQLEELAKTLIMVKYNLPFNWFNNP